MILPNNMKVGVALQLEGDATTKMEAFKKHVASAATSMERLEKNLKSTEIVLGTFLKRLQTVDGVLANFVQKVAVGANAFRALNEGVRSSSASFSSLSGRLSTASGRMANAARSAQLLKDELIGVAQAGAAAGVGIAGMRGGGGHGGHGTAHGVREISSEIGLGKMGAMAAMMGGPVGVAVGAALVGALLVKDSYQAASRFQPAQAQFAGQGFGAAANAQATSAALHMRVPGVSTVDALQAINDAATVTRNVPEAIQLAPWVAKMEVANKLNYATRGKSFTSGDEMRMLQFAELRSGSTDPNKYLHTLNLIEQGYASDAARLTTVDIRAASRQGASVLKNLSDTGLIALMPLWQSLGGYRTMTGVTTMQTSLEKGQNMRTGKRAMHEFERLGIFDNNGKLKQSYLGQLTQDPAEFILKSLVPAMARKGITSDAGIAQEFNILFTQSAARFAQQAISQQTRIAAQLGMVPKAAGIEGNFATAMNINPGHVQAFSSAWESMMTALGKASSPAVNAGLDVLTILFNRITAFFTDITAFFTDIGSLKTGNSTFSKVSNYLNNRVSLFVGSPNTSSTQGAANATDTQAMPQPHAAAVDNSTHVYVDSKEVAHHVVKHVTKALSNANIQTQSGFSVFKSPPAVSTGALG